MSKEDNSSNQSDSFTSFFEVTMLVMTTDTTSIEEQLVEMTHVVAKLTKTIEEKHLQIASLMSKAKAQG